MTQIPFNHSLALQGASVTTRSGKEVKQLTWFPDLNKWYGVVEHSIEYWEYNGDYYEDTKNSRMDLVMSPDCTPTPAVQKYDRAEIAAKMMAAIVSGQPPGRYKPHDALAAAEDAVLLTDALINELNKEKQ